MEHTHAAHSHSHAHHHHHHHGDSSKNIASAFFLNALFVVVEVVGGFLTNSIAILSDAIHDTGDCLSLGIAWGLQKKSKKGRDADYSYGYKRYSLLGSLFLSIFLIGSSAFIFVEAVKRILHPEMVEAQGMVWIALFGILINGAAALKVKRGSSLNERAVYLHIMEDALGWVAVLIASIVMLFVDFPYIDPILSIVIGIWVLYHILGNLREVFRVLLQGTPESVDMKELQERIEGLEGVQSIHDLHVWSLDGESHVMTLHLVPMESAAAAATAEIKHRIQELAHEYDIEHVTIDCHQPDEYCCCNCDA